MSELVRRFGDAGARQDETTSLSSGAPRIAAQTLQERALRQAGRELLLAQASDWPFILRTGTRAGYARKRGTQHLLRFSLLHAPLLVPRTDEDLVSAIP